MKFHWFLSAACAASLLQAFPIPNASFEQGEGERIPHWTLSTPGFGRVIPQAVHGKQALSFRGDGKSFNCWLSTPLSLPPGQIFRFSYRATSKPGSSGCIVAGPVFANDDTRFSVDSWEKKSKVFVVPYDLPTENYAIRFGNYFARGTFAVDDLKLTSVQPVYYQAEGITLGEGEKIDINEYTFDAPLDGSGSNHARPLAYASAGFNSMRWVMMKDSTLIYVHDLQSRQQLNAQVLVNIGYYQEGTIAVSASKDGKNWTPLASASQTGQIKAQLPQDWFPAQRILVKIQALNAKPCHLKNSDPGSFQIYGYTYKATLTGQPTAITGSTAYMEVDNKLKDLHIDLVSMDDCIPGRQNMVALKLVNNGNQELTIAPTSSARQEQTATKAIKGQTFTLSPKSQKQVNVPFTVDGTGTWAITVQLTPQTTIRFNATVPHYLNASYGKLLATSAQAALWSASSGWKVHPQRALPTATASAIELSMAANEAEAVQLVITPKQNLQGIAFKTSALAGPKGAIIPAENVEILSVYYHDIQNKTDSTSLLGRWPDALPPITAPLALKANQNQPFWIRVTAPKGTQAGTYTGTITVSDGNGWKQDVTLKAKVFNFTLPDKMTCETAFGLGLWHVWKYHNVHQPQQRRELMHKYMTALSKHHISPYNLAPMDPFKVSLTCQNPDFLIWKGQFSRDTQTWASTGASLLLIDRSRLDSPCAETAKTIPVPQEPLTLNLKYRTEQGNSAMVSLTFQDRKGRNIPALKQVFKLPGNGDWKTFTQNLKPLTKQAATCKITLRPVPWTQDGKNTGKTWFDDIQITAQNTNTSCFKDQVNPIDVKDYAINIDWTNWDKAMEQAFKTYHFNCFSMPIRGLGGGTFVSRREPIFFNFHEETQEYKHLHPKYLKMLQEHLREKGWLDKAYVYWFDEPAPKDYDFVMNGFRKLKEGAPEIRRMLTEQVEDDLIGGPNLWCPVSSNLDPTTIKPRMKQKDMFWWYVCCGPKAPYATLFIDHPGTEMRVWLWQTWQREIQGILVWQTTYWTSPSAYPDPKKPQNPYLDPMGWSAGSAKKPRKVIWGNGDGKFLYPPLAAANADSKVPIMDGPVDTIRIEMLRDGIEDYEYFVILKQLVDENRHRKSHKQLEDYRKLLLVPQDVTVSATEFTLDPKPMESHRLKLAKAIEELQ